MKVDWLVVGAGFTGAVLAERIATELDQRVLVVESRDHIGGNAFDVMDENGVLVHQYGPHIFHTNSRKVWDYLSRFTTWRPYFHRVLGSIDGQLVPVPFNFNSLYALYPPRLAGRLEDLLVDEFGAGARVPILRLVEHQSPEIRRLAAYVYENVFKGYTVKQWGVGPEELDSSVTARVPIVLSRDDRYFRDTYQALPGSGYTEMFRRILSHKNISVLLNTDFRDVIDQLTFNRMIYTGPIDTFFDAAHGVLPYRSLRFEFRHEQAEQFQDVAQVNYPNEFDFTRVTEFKHLTGQRCAGTTIAYEYPCEAGPGADPYYPVPAPESRAQFGRYRVEADRIAQSVVFAGRLADYRYYNIDQAVHHALNVFEERVARP